MRPYPTGQPRPDGSALAQPGALPPGADRKVARPARPARRSGATALPRKAKSAPSRKAPKSLPDLDRVARRLEADWQKALRKHEAAVHRQFRDLRAAFHKGKPLTEHDVVRLRRSLEPRLKPKKGRAKDLRRVEHALGDALASLD